MKVLLVDSQVGFRRSLAEYLTRRGMTVTGCNTAAEAFAALDHEAFDVALVEVNRNRTFLPRALEVAPSMPLVVVTGEPDWRVGVDLVTSGRVAGYMSKNDPDLRKRIVELIYTTAEVVTFDVWRVDLRNYDVKCDGVTVHLTGQEVDILVHFLRNPNRRIMYDELALVTGHEEAADDLGQSRRTLKSVMSNLRAKLGDFAGYEVINSLPYKGFRVLEAPDEFYENQELERSGNHETEHA